MRDGQERGRHRPVPCSTLLPPNESPDPRAKRPMGAKRSNQGLKDSRARGLKEEERRRVLELARRLASGESGWRVAGGESAPPPAEDGAAPGLGRSEPGSDRPAVAHHSPGPTHHAKAAL